MYVHVFIFQYLFLIQCLADQCKCWKLWLKSLVFSTFRTVWFFFLGRYYPLIYLFLHCSWSNGTSKLWHFSYKSSPKPSQIITTHQHSQSIFLHYESFFLLIVISLLPSFCPFLHLKQRSYFRNPKPMRLYCLGGGCSRWWPKTRPRPIMDHHRECRNNTSPYLGTDQVQFRWGWARDVWDMWLQWALAMPSLRETP